MHDDNNYNDDDDDEEYANDVIFGTSHSMTHPTRGRVIFALLSPYCSVLLYKHRRPVLPSLCCLHYPVHCAQLQLIPYPPPNV